MIPRESREALIQKEWDGKLRFWKNQRGGHYFKKIRGKAVTKNQRGHDSEKAKRGHDSEKAKRGHDSEKAKRGHDSEQSEERPWYSKNQRGGNDSGGEYMTIRIRHKSPWDAMKNEEITCRIRKKQAECKQYRYKNKKPL